MLFHSHKKSCLLSYKFVSHVFNLNHGSVLELNVGDIDVWIDVEVRRNIVKLYLLSFVATSRMKLAVRLMTIVTEAFKPLVGSLLLLKHAFAQCYVVDAQTRTYNLK